MRYTLLIKSTCPYSIAAVKFMKDKKLEYKVYTAGKDFEVSEFKERYGQDATFPRIYRGTMLMGGYDDLMAYFKS